MKKNRAVVISGLGVLSPIGLTIPELASSLSIARSGIGLVDAAPLLKSFPAGVIPVSFSSCFTRLELASLDRCQHLAILAARQAITDAGLDDFTDYGPRAGIYYGNVNGGLETEQLGYQRILSKGAQAMRPFAGMAIMRNGGAAQISIRHQVTGPVITHGSACSASGVAIGEAVRAIRDGYLDVVIAGGAEAPLVASLFGAFEGARALAPADPDDVSRSCKPFSRGRRGVVVGEGAAFLILEAEECASRRGAKCYGYMSGYGVAADAYHIGTPRAEGQAAAIRAALADAGLTPSDIDYLNAHATATTSGDSTECNAIRSVFGTSPESVMVSSTKSVHGHLLGAASALELVITVTAMNASLVPATAHLDEIDPGCALNHIPNKPLLDHPIERAMSFSCGFGGTNVALIISKHREMAG